LYLYYDISVSESSVATKLRCDGICNDGFIVNLPTGLPVKNCESLSLFGSVMDKSTIACFYTY